MTAAERQRMRNIAAADYFRRMKEEHARKEVEMQEARARQVEHAIVLAREQVRRRYGEIRIKSKNIAYPIYDPRVKLHSMVSSF